jgi:hypothetical protein
MFAGLLTFLPALRVGLPLRPPCLGGALSGGIRDRAVRHGHAGFGSERGDGGGKVEVITLANVADCVAVSLTAEAMEVPVFIDREARSLLAVEWAARLPPSPVPFELGDVATNQ